MKGCPCGRRSAERKSSERRRAAMPRTVEMRRTRARTEWRRAISQSARRSMAGGLLACQWRQSQHAGYLTALLRFALLLSRHVREVYGRGMRLSVTARRVGAIVSDRDA